MRSEVFIPQPQAEMGIGHIAMGSHSSEGSRLQVTESVSVSSCFGDGLSLSSRRRPYILVEAQLRWRRRSSVGVTAAEISRVAASR